MHQVGRLPARDCQSLTKGLADEMPDLEVHVNHILTKRVYGISTK